LGLSLESYDSFRQSTEASIRELSSQVRQLEKAVLRQIQTDDLAIAEKREQAFEQRVQIAAKETDFSDVPHLLLAALSEPEVRFDSLFSSRQDPLVHAFENPPEFRDMGFDFALHRSSEIIQGEIRRISIPGYKSMQLSVSGELVVFLTAEENFLAWASNLQGKPDVPIRINSFVLGEAIYAFTTYAVNIYKLSSPRPERLRLFIGLRNISRGGKPAILTSSEMSPYGLNYGFNDRQAPTASCLFSLEVSIDETAERMAYLLRAKIYSWFGFEDDRIPYATVDGDGRKIVNKTSLKI
jgi:hypothetical protein